MIRKVGIVALVLASLATGVLWIDSYRPRKPRLWSPEQEELRKHGIRIHGHRGMPDPNASKGIRKAMNFGDRLNDDRRILRIRTCNGSLAVRLDSWNATGTPILRRDHQFHAFGYKEWRWGSGSLYEDGVLQVPIDYHVREIRLPFIALFVAFSWYPLLAMVRGPLRRHGRRTRGRCIDCGYNLTGNESGTCPECGTPKEITPTVAARNKRDVFFLCIGLGIVFEVLAGLFAIGFEYWYWPYWGDPISRYLDRLPFAVGRGIVTGILWSAFAIPLLRRTPMWRATRLLVVIVTPVLLLSAWMRVFWAGSTAGPFLPDAHVPLPTVAFLLTCIYARMAIPNIRHGANIAAKL